MSNSSSEGVALSACCVCLGVRNEPSPVPIKPWDSMLLLLGTGEALKGKQDSWQCWLTQHTKLDILDFQIFKATNSVIMSSKFFLLKTQPNLCQLNNYDPTSANSTNHDPSLPTNHGNPNSAKFCIVSICSKCSYYLDSLLAEARALSLLGDCSSREELWEGWERPLALRNSWKVSWTSCCQRKAHSWNSSHRVCDANTADI